LDPDPDQLVRGTDPEIWIWIRTKMSRIPNTALGFFFLSQKVLLVTQGTLKITFFDLITFLRELMHVLVILVIHPAQHNLKTKIQCCGAGAVIRSYGSGPEKEI
jgi:hypothetical protein